MFVAQLFIGYALLAGGPVLRVRVDADAGLQCPANASLVKAARLRLPGVSVVEGGSAAGDDLVAALGESSSGWKFEVRRATGAGAMARSLSKIGDCGQLADTCALILDRYLAGGTWKGRRVDPLPKAASAG